MNKTLKPLFACLFSGLICTGAAAAEPQVINIKTDGSSMVMSVTSDGEVLFHHFGGRIDDAAPVTGIKSYRRTDHGTDNLAYSTMGGRNFREPALRVTHADGDMNTELRYVSHTTRTLADTNVTRTVIKLTDTNQALDVELFYTAYAEENVITTHAVIRNREKGSIVLHSFYSSSLPVKARSYLLTHLYGAWARESQVDHTLLTHGSKSIESRKQVRTTHTENPAFMITLDSESFDENYGEVIAGALAWSGNFRLNFEVDEFNVLNILAGANPYASDYTLGAGESFTTPEMIYTYSSEGAGGASRHLHDWARNYGVWHGHTYAPTLLNSWEGAYFTFDAKTLTEMIDDAADMGLEMFVLDDGWFGNKYPRNDSNAGLGDWQVNAKKLPEGIDYLVCPEAKAIPLTHAIARRLGIDYIVIRKTVKAYMDNPLIADVMSITTAAPQHLVMDSADVQKIYHKKVAIIDDVVSTGGSLRAVENILAKTACTVVAKAAPLLEEGGYDGRDLIYIQRHPVFTD